MSEDDIFAKLEENYVITIIIRPENPVPDVDLGQIPISEAIVLFEETAELLREMRMPPRISVDGETILDPLPEGPEDGGAEC